jgi:hypothetical protein
MPSIVSYTEGGIGHITQSSRQALEILCSVISPKEIQICQTVLRKIALSEKSNTKPK